MALDYPELSEQRTALKSFNVSYVLTHNGKMAKPWEERKPNHAGEAREEDLQGADIASFLYNFFIGHSIGHALRKNIHANKLHSASAYYQSPFEREIQDLQ